MLKKMLVAVLAVCAPVAAAQAAAPTVWSQPGSNSSVSATTPQQTPYVTSDATASFARADSGEWYNMPDLLGFSVGYYDALRNTPRKSAVDFRAEFRSGISLLPKIWSGFDGWDPYFQMRPMAGVEATSDGALYGFGGFMFDIPIGKHFFIAPNEVVGAYYRGNGKRLGSFVEFRSTLEVGYRFDNNLRIAASFGHISNAGLTQLNSGTEILSGNVYIPVNWVFGN